MLLWQQTEGTCTLPLRLQPGISAPGISAPERAEISLSYLGSEQVRRLPESTAREEGQARVGAPSQPHRRSVSGACEELLEGQQRPEGHFLPAKTDVLLVRTSMTLLDIKVLTFLHSD